MCTEAQDTMSKTKDVMQARARRFRFTWNNYTEENVELLKQLTKDDCDYIVFGFEKAPKTGTPHLQGYIEFSNPLLGSTAKSRLDPVLKKESKVCLLTCQANHAANAEYCKKDASKDTEAEAKYGGKYIEITHKERRQGKKENVIEQKWADVLETVNDGVDFAEFASKHTEIAIKHSSGIQTLIAVTKEAQSKAAMAERMKGAKLKPWQQKLEEQLVKPADDRKVTWIYDTVGGKGKTWFVKYMLANHEVARFENASSKDIAYAYKGEQIVFFDFSRTCEERVNYGVIESIKNGMLFSSKYASCQKYFDIPHVVIFANWPPNVEALSKDRWDIRSLDGIKDEIGTAEGIKATPTIPACFAEFRQPEQETQVGSVLPIPNYNIYQL